LDCILQLLDPCQEKNPAQKIAKESKLGVGGDRLISEGKKCPKCSGEMVQGEFLKNLPKIVVFSKEGRRSLDRVIPNYCKKCGFVEIYKELKE